MPAEAPVEYLKRKIAINDTGMHTNIDFMSISETFFSSLLLYLFPFYHARELLYSDLISIGSFHVALAYGLSTHIQCTYKEFPSRNYSLFMHRNVGGIISNRSIHKVKNFQQLKTEAH